MALPKGINDDLRYDNLNTFVKLQSEGIDTFKSLAGRLLERLEQLEVEAKVHPVKKMLGVRAK